MADSLDFLTDAAALQIAAAGELIAAADESIDLAAEDLQSEAQFAADAWTGA